MANNLAAVAWATLASLLGTGVGGFLGCFGGRIKGVLPAALGFTAGLMSAIVCFGLLPEAYGTGGILVALMGFAAGVAAVWLAGQCLPGKAGGLERTSFLVLAAIAMHNLPEGLAIGSGWAALPELGAKLAFVICLHDLPEGVAITAPMAAARGGRPFRQAALAVLTGVPTGVGAVLGVFLGSVSPIWMSWCLGFAAGAMLYVTTGEMVPQLIRAEGRHKTVWQLLGFTVGVVVSWI